MHIFHLPINIWNGAAVFHICQNPFPLFRSFNMQVTFLHTRYRQIQTFNSMCKTDSGRTMKHLYNIRDSEVQCIFRMDVIGTEYVHCTILNVLKGFQNIGSLRKSIFQNQVQQTWDFDKCLGHWMTMNYDQYKCSSHVIPGIYGSKHYCFGYLMSCWYLWQLSNRFKWISVFS